MSKTTVVLFRNDLRIHDNPLLNTVAKLAQPDLPVLCIYCFDPRHFKETKFGSKKTGEFRAKFTLEAVHNLRQNLKTLGTELIVTFDKPEIIVPKLLTKGGDVVIHGEVTPEELKVENMLEESLLSFGAKLHRIHGGSTLYHPDDIPFDKTLANLPDGFTPFKDKVEKNCKS